MAWPAHLGRAAPDWPRGQAEGGGVQPCGGRVARRKVAHGKEVVQVVVAKLR